MIMKVLQTNNEIKSARLELIKKGASHVDLPDSRLKAGLRRLGLVSSVVMGDMVKSWDVLATLNFLVNRLDKTDSVLDIGCYASEILLSLHQTGFTNLTGADLNPALKKMPFSGKINYEITNFMKTSFPDASFKAITSISVIEHGFDGDALLKEVSRLLQPGGYFISSFDYWPEKIDTTGVTFFGMDWKIFSKEEVVGFVKDAAAYGLFPEGPMKFEGQDRPIDCADKQYTFGWLVLCKPT